MGWILIAVMLGLVVSWLIVFAMDPDAFQPGSRR
jgi:hypothetical protein